VRIRFVLAVICLATARVVAAQEAGTNVFEEAVAPAATSELDKIVFDRLEQLKVRPVLCSDAVFVRRAYLDVLGTLPTAAEAREFIQDSDSPNKRRLLVEKLLERDEFADYWAMKWSDILRIKAEFPINLWPNAAQTYHHWVRTSIAENKPYDQFVRELLTSSGSNFKVGPVNFYRALQNRTPEGIARAVALSFMGTRVDSWPTNRLAGMAAFFSQIGYKPTGEWKEEHVFWDPLGSSSTPGDTAPGRANVAAIAQFTNGTPLIPKRAGQGTTEAAFPDGTQIQLSTDRDPREIFAGWLVTPKNRWFTRCIANRIWAWLLGRGIIHETDDIRDDNPPSNPELLAYLEKEMVADHYDLKKFYHLILCSQTYQLSSIPHCEAPEAATNFASYGIRRLEAEVLSDAVNKVAGTSDLYTSPIPEPFTYIPKGVPAVSIPDGSITSPFLALFGRSPRATGMENERNNRPTPSQVLYLLNSSDVQRKLEQGTNLQEMLAFSAGRRPMREIADDLYLTILSRFPTPEEVKAIEEYRIPPPKPPPATNSTNVAAAKPVQSTNSLALATNQSEPAHMSTNVVALNSATNSSSAKSNGVKIGPIGSLGTKKGAGKRPPTKRREEWVDVAWSLINSEEFLYRH
jgi:hypothetical protein